MKTERLAIYAGTVVLLGALAWVLFLGWREWREKMSHSEEGMSATKLEAGGIAFAISEYYRLFGDYPSGSSVAIAKALAGENPKKIVLIKFPRLGRDGEMLDPWGIPYDIRFIEAGRLQVRSAGPNRIMGDADDTLEQHLLTDKTNSPSAADPH